LTGAQASRQSADGDDEEGNQELAVHDRTALYYESSLRTVDHFARAELRG
jgi:hypothetical protein